MQSTQPRKIIPSVPPANGIPVKQIVHSVPQRISVPKDPVSKPINQTVVNIPFKPPVQGVKPRQEIRNSGWGSPKSDQDNKKINREKQPNANIPALDQQDLKDILFELGRVLLMTQIYKASHPIVHEKLSKLSILMIKIANAKGRLVLSNREDLIFLNGYQERVTTGPLQKLEETLKYLKVASFEFEKGITEQEISGFFTTIATQKKARESGDIKEILKKSGLVHIRPIFLQYVEADSMPKEVPEPKNVIEGKKHGLKKGHDTEEQIITDFLKGKLTDMPKKVNTFLLDHPKLAAMVLVKMLDEYEDQNLDSFAAFQAYVQSLTHYMARLSRLIKDPDKVEKTLRKLEKHLVVRLKSLKKDRKYINETKHQIKDALSWVQIEQLLSHYEEAKANLSEREQDIIEAIEKKKVPSVTEFKERLNQLGPFESKLSKI